MTDKEIVIDHLLTVIGCIMLAIAFLCRSFVALFFAIGVFAGKLAAISTKIRSK